MKKAMLVLAVVMALGLGLVPAQAATQSATIAGFQYVEVGSVPPTNITAVRGDTVNFTNFDALPHTAKTTVAICGTNTTPATCSTAFINTGATLGWTIRSGAPTGAYAITCQVHPGLMQGTLLVS